MPESPCILDSTERKIVEKQTAETCRYRGWELHAVNCRSNHVHVVVSATDTAPKKIRVDLKAWCARRLKQHTPGRRQEWWAERGSVRWVWNSNSLATVVEYVIDAQDRKDRDAS